MAERVPTPTRQMPFVDDDGKLTQRSSEWVNLVNLAIPIQGTGSPEGVVEALIGQWFIDTDIVGSTNFLYIKQFSDITGNRKNGWQLIL